MAPDPTEPLPGSAPHPDLLGEAFRDPEAPGDTPRRFGRFRIRKELGRGGFGVVFLVDDPLMGRRAALKVPRLEALSRQELRDRFLLEVRAAARLDHPNVVPVYESGEVGGVCYMVSAYCPGPTLYTWLAGQGEPVAPRLAAAVTAALADAAEHAHGR